MSNTDASGGIDPDVGVAVCVAAALGGLLASTTWVVVASGTVSSLGLL